MLCRLASLLSIAVVTATTLTQPAVADTTPVLAPFLTPMTPSGVQQGVKIWSGVYSTTTGGAWSADLTSMGCSAAPAVVTQAVSSSTDIASSAVSTVTSLSATSVAGFVNLPNTIAVGGSPVQRAGSGLGVHVVALCR